MSGPDQADTESRVDGATPIVEAARAILDVRLAAVRQRLAGVRESADAPAKAVHGLRVSSRRAAAALGVFRDVVPKRDGRRIRRTLRRLRQAAALARTADVHATMVGEFLVGASGARAAACGYALGRLGVEAELGRLRLADAVKRAGAKRVARHHGRLIDRLREAESGDGATFGAAGREVVEDAFTRVELAMTGDLSSAEKLHELRLVVKRFRYVVEVVEPCLDAEAFAETMKQTRALQKRLGELNDLAELEARLEEYARELEGSMRCEEQTLVISGLRAMQGEIDRACVDRREALMVWWAERGGPARFVSLQHALMAQGASRAATGVRPTDRVGEAATRGANGEAVRP